MSILPQEHWDMLDNAIKHNTQRVKEFVQTRHAYKLAKLRAANNNEYVNKDRWVVNLSSRKLTSAKTAVLRYGLNFAPVPKEIHIPEIIASIESGIRDLPEGNKESVRATVTNILKYSKPPTNCNLSRQQKLALKSLRRDNNIIIIPADKGKAVVVMDNDEHTNKINELLSDKETYLKTTDRRRSPVSKIEKDLTKLLSDIKKTPSEHDPETTQMDERLYLHLHSTDGPPARFYGLPKVHKPAVPLRPITSCINFPTYNLSKHLVKILSLLVKEKYTVKNSSVFSQQVRHRCIADDEVMVPFDVVSLFTSIPTNLSLQVIQKRLQQDTLLTQRTHMSITNIIKLLDFVLQNSFSTYKNEYYQQISGCAMGSPVSATVADIIMEHVEETAISTAPHPPRWRFRYVDDSHSCLKKTQVNEFHDHLNSINPHLQFTVELEENRCLPFLDTMTIRSNGKIEDDIYRKLTHTDKYSHHDSHHPLQHKLSVLSTLLDRAEKMPSSNKGKRRERKHVLRVLRDNGYPFTFIRSYDHKRKRHHTDKTNANVHIPCTGVNNRGNPADCVASSCVTLPYVKGVTGKVSKVLRRENIKVRYKPTTTLSQQFTKPKDKSPPEQTNGVVYKICCYNCDFVYYGQTDRALKTRIKEHEIAVSHFDQYSKIAKHAEQYDHQIDFNNAFIVNAIR